MLSRINVVNGVTSAFRVMLYTCNFPAFPSFNKNNSRHIKSTMSVHEFRKTETCSKLLDKKYFEIEFPH